MMGMFTQAFKRTLIWCGIPEITIDQVLGYREERCMCGDPKCQGVRARIAMDLHILKDADGSLRATPIEDKARSLVLPQ